jgi:hypothetical protein
MKMQRWRCHRCILQLYNLEEVRWGGSPTGNRTLTLGLRIQWTNHYPMGPS